jgi:hypothetical protein
MSQENVERGVRSRLSLPSGRSAQRRSLDERFFVRFPAAYRLGAAAWMRLSPECRLRRLFLARIGGRAMAAVNRRDFGVLFLAIDPNIEYHPAGDQLPLDMDEVSHGHKGYEKVWRQMITPSRTSVERRRQSSTWATSSWPSFGTQDTVRGEASRWISRSFSS